MLYLSATFVCIGGAVFLLGFVFFSRAPSCSDGALNGDERGVDCGGSCERLCPFDVQDPVVVWARSFLAARGIYTATAYVENPNPGARSAVVPYLFKLFDENNILVAEREGSIALPPERFIPVVEPNVSVGNRIPTRTFFEFTGPVEWFEAPRALLRVTDEVLSDEGTRLTALLHNDTGEDVERVTVAAVLFDSEGVARASARSLVGKIKRGEQEPLVFTWTLPPPPIARITIIPLME